MCWERRHPELEGVDTGSCLLRKGSPWMAELGYAKEKGIWVRLETVDLEVQFGKTFD